MKKNKLILNKDEILNVLGKKYDGLSDIFSNRFGIINAMLERHELDKYGLFMYQCLSADTKKIFNISRDVSSGGLGIHEKKDIAMIGCLAEALERYCMSYIPPKEIISCKKNELASKYTFSDFSTYTKYQYNKYNEFLNPNLDIIDWTKIYDIHNTNHYMYWPASLIYLPFDINKPIAETTSTGMAAGFSIDECIKSGLMELIERDALMINFMQRLNPPEIDTNTIDGESKKLIDSIKEEYKIKIYRLYSDINAPIYLSIIYKYENKKIHYGIGACAGLDSDKVICKSLKECLFTYFYSLNIMDVKQNNCDKIKTLYEHFLYYQEDNFDKLLFDSDIVKYQKEIVRFDDVIKSLKTNNINVYYKELTTSDVKPTGIKVVKIIAPSLIDLNKSHIYPRLGAKRYWDVPKKLNIPYHKKLSDMPHPFP